MKQLVLFACILLSGLLPLRLAAQGPDDYGYTYITEQDGATFDWVDIEQPANELVGLTDDNFIEVNLGFEFKYYWGTYTKFVCGSNGYLMFGPPKNVASGAGGFETFPMSGTASSPNNYIGMLLADLTFSDTHGDLIPDAKVYGKKTAENVYVLTYKNVPHWVREQEAAGSYRGSNTFQCILNGNDRSITLNYKSCTGPVSSSYASGNWNVIGMENITGLIGLTVRSKQYPTEGQVVKFIYPEQPTYQVTDVTPAWIFTPSNQGFIVGRYSPETEIKAGIKNSGNMDIDASAPVTVRLTVYNHLEDIANQAETPIDALSDVVTLNNLKADSVGVVTFNKKFNPQDIGNYRIKIAVENNNDVVPANDFLESELVVADTSLDIIPIGYDRFLFRDIPDPTPIPWSNQEGAAGGGLTSGMSFTLPFSPANIDEARMTAVIIGNGAAPDTLLGFSVKLYRGNGPNGSPGDLLGEGTFNPSDYVDGLYLPETPIPANQFVIPERDLTVTFNPPISHRWAGETVYMEVKGLDGANPDVTDNRKDLVIAEVSNVAGVSCPTSYRSYEISGGVWAPYRERNSTDFAFHLGISKSDAVSVEDKLAQGATLGAAYPNPAVAEANIPFKLIQTAPVQLTVRNMMGQVVETRDLGNVAPGSHKIAISGSQYANGLYSYTLKVNTREMSGKFLIAK